MPRRGAVVRARGNNPDKNAAMRAFGAELIEDGRDFDEARERCRARAENRARYVHSANEPLLIAGVGTYALEVFEDLPNADVDWCRSAAVRRVRLITVRTALGAKAQIIGVGANADAVYRSWGTATRRRHRGEDVR